MSSSLTDPGPPSESSSDDALLLMAVDALSGSLNLRRTASRLTQFLVDHIADASMTSWITGHHIEQVAVFRHPTSGVQRRQLRRPVGSAERVVESTLADGTPGTWCEALRVDEEQPRSLLEPAGVANGIVLPLRARGSIIGCCVVGWRDGPPSAAAMATLESMVARAALLLDNCRLYNERSGAAQVLFRSVLPADLPSPTGLEVGAHYATAAAEADVGGDFYDLFPLDSGRWGLVLGDVCGKGHEAAAFAAEARHVVRACLVGGMLVSAALETLNRVLLLHSDGRFCTVVAGIASISDNLVSLSLATGGHPSPVIVRARGGVASVPLKGSLVGMFDDIVVDSIDVHLEPGDSLILCTDGVLEARSGSREFGEHDFHQLLELCGGLPADALAARLVQTVQTFSGGEQSDDLAVLVLRCTEKGAHDG